MDKMKAEITRTCDLTNTFFLYRTTATFTCKSSVVALDWLGKLDRFFVLGTRSGSIHLCDSIEKKVVWEMSNQAGSPLKDTRYLKLTV
jgi:hypothetical protein